MPEFRLFLNYYCRAVSDGNFCFLSASIVFHLFLSKTVFSLSLECVALVCSYSVLLPLHYQTLTYFCGSKINHM